MIESKQFRIEVLLSFQRALWDAVTPSLRAVSTRLDYPRIAARFLYERVGEEEREITAEVEGEVIADFNPPVVVDFVAVPLPTSSARALETGEEWVYLRRE